MFFRLTGNLSVHGEWTTSARFSYRVPFVGMTLLTASLLIHWCDCLIVWLFVSFARSWIFHCLTSIVWKNGNWSNNRCIKYKAEIVSLINHWSLFDCLTVWMWQVVHRWHVSVFSNCMVDWLVGCFTEFLNQLTISKSTPLTSASLDGRYQSYNRQYQPIEFPQTIKQLINVSIN